MNIEQQLFEYAVKNCLMTVGVRKTDSSDSAIKRTTSWVEYQRMVERLGGTEDSTYTMCFFSSGVLHSESEVIHSHNRVTQIKNLTRNSTLFDKWMEYNRL